MARNILRILQLLLGLLAVGLLAFLVWQPRPRQSAAVAVLPSRPLPTYSGVVPTPPVVPTPSVVPTPPVAGQPVAPTPPVVATGHQPTPTMALLAVSQGVAAAESTVITGSGGQAAATSWPLASVAAVPSATPIPPTPALAPPQPLSVNGVPFEVIVVMPPEVVAHVREIYATGQALGRNPNAYAKVGDSTIENPHFMTRFDEGGYNLGDYASLQPVIDQFRGSHARDSVAVRIGLHAWTANDPAWAEPGLCLPNETPVACEIRLQNPSILLIRLGTNDAGVPELFANNIRQILDTAIAAGVIPVIGTKGDFHEGSDENNAILRALAAEYRVPLWDYARVADTLPGRGLDQDAAHMLTFYSHDYTDPTAFTRGHAMHNLTALMALDAVWRLREGP